MRSWRQHCGLYLEHAQVWSDKRYVIVSLVEWLPGYRPQTMTDSSEWFTVVNTQSESVPESRQ